MFLRKVVKYPWMFVFVGFVFAVSLFFCWICVVLVGVLLGGVFLFVGIWLALLGVCWVYGYVICIQCIFSLILLRFDCGMYCVWLITLVFFIWTLLGYFFVF